MIFGRALRVAHDALEDFHHANWPYDQARFFQNLAPDSFFELFAGLEHSAW